MNENESAGRASSRETAPTREEFENALRVFANNQFASGLAQGDDRVCNNDAVAAKDVLVALWDRLAASRAPAEPRTVSVLISAKELAALTRLANTIDNALGTRDADAVDEWITNARLMLADQRVATENDLARAPAETSAPAADEPFVTRPNGNSYAFVEELTDAERSYFVRYRGLTPEQQRELEEFAEHLKAKAAAKATNAAGQL